MVKKNNEWFLKPWELRLLIGKDSYEELKLSGDIDSPNVYKDLGYALHHRASSFSDKATALLRTAFLG